jgi:sterol desaturase/sphingolipid hydroxylase (fatty acid hydroxylase superfamily)
VPANVFTDANALATLLTVEGLLFAAVSVALSLSNPGSRVRDTPIAPKTLGYLAATFLSLVAFGALMAWWTIFAVDWPCGFRNSVIALTIGIAIVGQPAFAWAIALGLRTKK